MFLATVARSSLLILTMLFSLRPFSQLVTLIAAKYPAKCILFNVQGIGNESTNVLHQGPSSTPATLFLVSIGTGLTSSMEGSGRAHNVHPGFKGAVSQNINVLVCQIPPFLISQICR